MIYTIDEIKQRVTPVAEKYQLRSVYLFGSYARNEATDDSDVDVLVDTEGSTVRTLFDMGGLYNDLSDGLEKVFDLVDYGALTQDGENSRTPWFTDNVIKERLLIYER